MGERGEEGVEEEERGGGGKRGEEGEGVRGGEGGEGEGEGEVLGEEEGLVGLREDGTAEEEAVELVEVAEGSPAPAEEGADGR